MKKKKKVLTKAQLDVLFECWKNGDNTKEWLDLIAKNLPKIPSLIALSVMRKMAKTDAKWQKAIKRKKNKQEKEKLEKKNERERRKAVVAQKRQEREKRLAEKSKVRDFKEKIENIRQNLKAENIKEISELIKVEYFFCSDIDQYINNISCIFRLFSNEYSALLDSRCEKCQKMNKYIQVLEEVINNARPKKTRRHRTCERGSKVEEKISTTQGTDEATSNT